jgi:hypothetical protein
LKKKKRTKERKLGPNEVIYKVKVRTGNCNNAGTDANVHLTICGKRCDLPRKQLFNKYNAIKSETGYKFRFERNSSHVFKLVGHEAGPLTHIIVEVHNYFSGYKSTKKEEALLIKIMFE